MQELDNVTLNKEGEDKWLWKKDVAHVFIVKSSYNALFNDVFEIERELYENFWMIKALPLAQFLAWSVIKNKVPTKNNWNRKGVVFDTVLCVMCGEKEEIVTHLFLHYNITKTVWNVCYIWIDEVTCYTLIQNNI